MILKRLFCLVGFSLMLTCVIAQTQTEVRLEKIAREDVKKFKLSKTDLKLYRKGSSGRTSDYFKPRAENVSDTSLLRDSTYVKMYRHKAYEKNSLRKSAGEYLILSGIALVAAAVIIVTAL